MSPPSTTPRTRNRTFGFFIGDLPGLRSSRFCREFLALLDRLFDGADHVESRLRQVIVFSFDQALEALDRVGESHELAGSTREHFGDMERLRQEALDLAGARHRHLILFRKL